MKTPSENVAVPQNAKKKRTTLPLWVKRVNPVGVALRVSPTQVFDGMHSYGDKADAEKEQNQKETLGAVEEDHEKPVYH